MRTLRIVFLVLTFVAICVASVSEGSSQVTSQAASQVSAQDAPKVPENSKADSPAPLPEYVLEVTRPEGCIATPVSPKTKYACLVYALPRPARVPPDTSGQPITSKVNVWAIPDGDEWRIRVSIGTGEFFDAGDHKVGEFKLSTNERVSVPDVRKFGLTPIRVGVMKIVRQPARTPAFKNLTESVSLESIEAVNLPDPFKLTLKNNSTRNLIAIQYNIFGPRGFLDLKWLSSGLLVPLVKAGETYKLEVKSEDNTCGDDQGFHPNQLQKIDLVSAVFEDGTYEGEPALAALVKGVAFGNRKNLALVMETIANANDPAELAQQMSYLQAGMNEQVDPFLIDRLQSMFPNLNSDARETMINYIRSGMHEVKTNLLLDAQHLRAVSQHNNPQINKRAVETTKAKYERWWTGAQNMTSQ